MIGFYFLLRALYHTSVEEPFQKQKQAELELKFLAYHDELTKLPNSRYFKEKLVEELERNPGKKHAVLLLDIYRFKTINDSLSHSFGDSVLECVALRLQTSLPSHLFLGRIRGDAFTIFLNSFDNDKEIITLCHQIQDLLKEPFHIQHLHLNVTVNVGVAIYPNDGQNEDELLRHDQMANYEAQNEVHRYKFFQSYMDQQPSDRLVLEHDLHQALAKDQLYLVYQPQMVSRTGQILGLEALIRWKHPNRGWISPSTFIPITEETGLIVPIGEWLLRTACRQMKLWYDQGFLHMGVSVNLSTRQFFQ